MTATVDTQRVLDGIARVRRELGYADPSDCGEIYEIVAAALALLDELEDVVREAHYAPLYARSRP